MFYCYDSPEQNLCFFSFCFFVLFSVVGVHAKAGSWGRSHAAYPIGPLNALFLRCKKNTSEQGCIGDLYTRASENPSKKSVKFFGTGSRMGATPGRLVAQNRWFLKGFCAEGRLHRTRGRDRPGAHLACC